MLIKREARGRAVYKRYVQHDLCNLCHALLLLTCVVCLKLIFCCNYFEVLHLYKQPDSAYFIRYKVRGGAFDLAVEMYLRNGVKIRIKSQFSGFWLIPNDLTL